MNSYKTKGTCSREILFDIKDNVIKNVEFIGGCAGNLLGIGSLVKGMKVDDAIEKLNKKTGVAVPKPLVGIKDGEVLHKTHIDKTEIINFIKSEMEGL